MDAAGGNAQCEKSREEYRKYGNSEESNTSGYFPLHFALPAISWLLLTLSATFPTLIYFPTLLCTFHTFITLSICHQYGVYIYTFANGWQMEMTLFLPKSSWMSFFYTSQHFCHISHTFYTFTSILILLHILALSKPFYSFLYFSVVIDEMYLKYH